MDPYLSISPVTPSTPAALLFFQHFCHFFLSHKHYNICFSSTLQHSIIIYLPAIIFLLKKSFSICLPVVRINCSVSCICNERKQDLTFFCVTYFHMLRVLLDAFIIRSSRDGATKVESATGPPFPWGAFTSYDTITCTFNLSSHTITH